MAQLVRAKTVIYWLVVALLRFLERVIEYWMGGGRLSGIPDYAAVHFPWHRFLAVQIWIFTLFLIYTTAAELGALFGEGEITRIVFTRGSSQLKLTRRQRIRTPVKLTRLTGAHTLDELRDPHGGSCRDARADPRTFDAQGEVAPLIRGAKHRV
jgi:hypothetical protein